MKKSDHVHPSQNEIEGARRAAARVSWHLLPRDNIPHPRLSSNVAASAAASKHSRCIRIRIPVCWGQHYHPTSNQWSAAKASSVASSPAPPYQKEEAASAIELDLENTSSAFHSLPDRNSSSFQIRVSQSFKAPASGLVVPIGEGMPKTAMVDPVSPGGICTSPPPRDDGRTCRAVVLLEFTCRKTSRWSSMAPLIEFASLLTESAEA